MNQKVIKKKLFFNNTILKFFLKKGNLKIAEKHLNLLLKVLFKRTSLGEYFIFFALDKILKTNFEIRNIKRRNITHIVPIPVKKKRQRFLATKFLFEAALKDKSRIPIAIKLSNEFLKYFGPKYQYSDSYLKKEFTKTTALKYRSNCHFRWY